MGGGSGQWSPGDPNPPDQQSLNNRNPSTSSTARGPTPRRSASGTAGRRRAAGGEDRRRPRRPPRSWPKLPPSWPRAAGRTRRCPAGLFAPLQSRPVPRTAEGGRFRLFVRRRGKPPSPAQQFAAILREGPPLGIHSFIWCDTYSNVSRMLDRQSLRDFEMRVLFQMNANDSSSLMDAPGRQPAGRTPGDLLRRRPGPGREVPPLRPALCRLAGLGQEAVARAKRDRHEVRA